LSFYDDSFEAIIVIIVFYSRSPLG
jgi:hypothetical protein